VSNFWGPLQARDSRLNRTVAIKIAKGEFQERFEREARAVAALNHPHICQVYDVGPSYIVMELIEGAQLRGPKPLEKAVELAGQILDALEVAHRNGIVHRDLKPANVLVTKSGVKLLDFGLAKHVRPLKETDSTLAAGLTHEGQILGTLHYMAPEQLQGKEADARSDLFSFGCVLYELISGKRAFDGESAASVITGIVGGTPEPLPVSTPLQRVIDRCLAKEPDQRFQNANDLKTALNWAMGPLPAPKPTLRKWAPVAAALLIGGAVGWGLAYRRSVAGPSAVLRFQLNPPKGARFVFGQNVGGMALSPDGRIVAFVAQNHLGSALWIQPLEGGTARPVTGSQDAHAPFWSPDSKSIGFFTATKLMRTDVEGATPLVLCDAVSGRGGTWNSDGRIVFATAEAALFQIPSSGGARTTLTTLDKSRLESAHYWPQMLPDGALLLWVRSSIPENSGIYVTSLANPGDRVQVLRTETNAFYASPAGGRTGYLVWLRGSTMVAQEFQTRTRQLRGEPYVLAGPVGKTFNLGRMNASVTAGLVLYSMLGGPGRLTWFDRAGNRLGSAAEAGEVHSFRISPDGRRIAVARMNEHGRSDVWLVDGERGVWNRWTALPGFSANPVWSPDARSIVFGTGVPRSLLRKDLREGTEERLTESADNQFASDWSRDGQYISYDLSTPHTGFDIWVLPVSRRPDAKPAEPPWTYLSTTFTERWSRFSPEIPARWIAYNSDETGRYEVYIDAFPKPRAKVRITTGGGRFPQWGRDALELFYVSFDDKLMSVSLRVQGEMMVPLPPREMFALPSAGTLLSPYEVAPDGQRFLVQASTDADAESLTVLVNWPALLKTAAVPQ
jgi:Tol biopolymer transport system component